VWEGEGDESIGYIRYLKQNPTYTQLSIKIIAGKILQDM
jgi:hypothetical protein